MESLYNTEYIDKNALFVKITKTSKKIFV